MKELNRRVLVIGGGVAGISAACRLAEHGVRTTLSESRPYLGGRARSFLDASTAETIDNGQHVMMACYHSFLTLTDMLGTTGLLRRQSALRVPFYDADGRKDLLDAGQFSGSLGMALGIVRLRGLSWTSKRRILLLAGRLRGKTPALDKEHCLEFLLRCRQTEESIRRFWTPIILATLNASPEAASATLLVETLRRAFFGSADASALLTPTEGLSALFEPFESWLAERGGQALLSRTVERVSSAGLKPEARFAGEESAQPYDGVVLAIPPRALLRCIDAPSLLPQWEILNRLRVSPIVSVYLWTDISIMEDDFAALLGTTVQWVFNRRRLCTASAESFARYGGHLALTVSAGDDLVEQQPEQLAQNCFAELQGVFPSAKSARLLAWKVIKEKSATILATPDTERLRPVTATLHPRIALAGDWTNTGLPATLEGAAQSGFAAADLLLSAFGQNN